MPEIPVTWVMRKVGHSFNTIGSGTTPNTDQAAYYNDADVNWINTGDLNDGYLTETKKRVSQVALQDLSTLRIYPENSLIVAMYGATIGKLAITAIEGCTNQACAVLANSSVFNIRYAFYWFLASKQHILTLASGGGQPNINQELIRALKMPCPPAEEQQCIVDFLDDKTAQIDQLITQKQQMLELLQEERAALVNHAVTKGLDPAAPLRDSGIEWLGQVPAHWEVVKLTTYLESIVDYRGRTPNKISEGVFLVTARNVKGGKIDYALSEEYVSLEEWEKFMQRGAVEIGDVLFTMEAPLGEAANVDRTDICLAQRLVKFRGKPDKLNNYFLRHWIGSHVFQNDLQSFATGSTVLGIKSSKLNQLTMLIPPLDEQAKIVDFIGTNSERMNETIFVINQEIALLQEYRAALIAEAVTGQIDVRNNEPALAEVLM